MINLILLFVITLLLLVIGWFLWKSGFLFQAEKPKELIDQPVMDHKERKAVMKRLRRWREEGKLSRSEYENVISLCESEWDPNEEKTSRQTL